MIVPMYTLKFFLRISPQYKFNFIFYVGENNYVQFGTCSCEKNVDITTNDFVLSVLFSAIEWLTQVRKVIIRNKLFQHVWGKFELQAKANLGHQSVYNRLFIIIIYCCCAIVILFYVILELQAFVLLETLFTTSGWKVPKY